MYRSASDLKWVKLYDAYRGRVMDVVVTSNPSDGSPAAYRRPQYVTRWVDLISCSGRGARASSELSIRLVAMQQRGGRYWCPDWRPDGSR